MWKVLLIFIFALIDSFMMTDYHSKYRPQLHFSVPKGWMNDPNGFVYYNGFYHLFYQYNPNDTKWGPMHWGHTISKDLIHWTNKEIALEPYELGTIYSGSAVIDRKNITGLKDNFKFDPMIIVYTLDASGFETQGLAYTSDGGETFKQYRNNPIINNPNIRDFRDPNVFYYNNEYYVLSLAAGDRVQFYNSTDLINWQFLSEFGNNPGQGERRGIWECPSLFELPVTINGEQQKSKWILIVSLNLDNDEEKRGSVTQYFVGDFNGKEFINSNSNNTILWSDYGPDNYASILLSENPENSVILIGWMSNWMYGAFTPTDTWRGQATLPREIGLERVRNQWFLTQRPIDRIFKLRDYPNSFFFKNAFTFGEESIFVCDEQVTKNHLFNIEIKFEIDGKLKSGEFGVRIKNRANEFIRLGYNITSNKYYFDRRNSGQSIHENFLRQIENDRISDNMRVYQWKIIVDTSSVEFFADSGLNIFTGIYYPTEYYNKIEMYAFNLVPDENEKTSSLKITSLSVFPMKSVWK